MGRKKTTTKTDKQNENIKNYFENLPKLDRDAVSDDFSTDLENVVDELKATTPQTSLKDLPIIEKVVDTTPEIGKAIVKNGIVKLGENKKLTKADFVKLNKKEKYVLQKRDESSKSYLKMVTRTVTMRPDLIAIIDDLAKSSARGTKAKLINNALIKELVERGVLDEESLSELRKY